MTDSVSPGIGVSVCSAAGSDILNDARWLSENAEVSFASFNIVHESSPLLPGGFFRSLIPYDKDGDIISPIAKLECSTPREQSSGGLLTKGICS